MNTEERLAAIETDIALLKEKQREIGDYKAANEEFVLQTGRNQELIERYEKLTDEGTKQMRENTERVFSIVRRHKELIDDITRRVYECYYHLFPKMRDVVSALSEAAKAAGKEKSKPT